MDGSASIGRSEPGCMLGTEGSEQLVEHGRVGQLLESDAFTRSEGPCVDERYVNRGATDVLALISADDDHGICLRERPDRRHLQVADGRGKWTEDLSYHRLHADVDAPSELETGRFNPFNVSGQRLEEAARITRPQSLVGRYDRRTILLRLGGGHDSHTPLHDDP